MYYSFILTHVWLAFEKGYDEMKNVKYKLYQNTNTVTLIETYSSSFYNHNPVLFLFSHQKHDFSVIWVVGVDAQRRVL